MLQHSRTFCPAGGKRSRWSNTLRSPYDSGPDSELLQPGNHIRTCFTPGPVPRRLHYNLAPARNDCPSQRRRAQLLRSTRCPSPATLPGRDCQRIDWPDGQMQRIPWSIRSRNTECATGHFETQAPPPRREQLPVARQGFQTQTGNARVATRIRRVRKDHCPRRPTRQRNRRRRRRYGKESHRRRERLPGRPYTESRQTGPGRAGIANRITSRAPNRSGRRQNRSHGRTMRAGPTSSQRNR